MAGGDAALAAQQGLALFFPAIAAKRRRNGTRSLPNATAFANEAVTPARAHGFARPRSLPLFGLLLLSRP